VRFIDLGSSRSAETAIYNCILYKAVAIVQANMSVSPCSGAEIHPGSFDLERHQA
jgi:hypothetical protein